jgi:uncharacterized membrane protein
VHGLTTWIHQLGAGWRLMLALATGIVCFVALPAWMSFEIRLISAWNSSAACYLALSWLMISGTTASETRRSTQARKQSGTAILAVVVMSCLASLGALGFLMQNLSEASAHTRLLHIGLSLLALALSWCLIHTRFAIHYAHRYYEHARATKNGEGGLQFPGQRPPDYLDFAYFSFVIGMTSQVSDIAVSTRSMRRLLLIHSVLAFGFNIAVLALSINIVASAL